jgi:molybdenum cofactor sulfurtransferase
MRWAWWLRSGLGNKLTFILETVQCPLLNLLTITYKPDQYLFTIAFWVKNFSNLNSMMMGDNFPQLKGQIYLDSAGCPPVPKQIMDCFYQDMISHHYGNPHSNNPSSLETTQRILGIQRKILNFLGTDESMYSIVFTMNASSSLELLSNSLNIENGKLVMLNACHTSVLGMAPVLAAKMSARVDDILVTVTEKQVNEILTRNDTKFAPGMNIFAYPAQCNFTGRRFPHLWVNQLADKGNWLVLIDAASYCATCSFNLNDHPADFLVLSFYKMFGFPTGVGALIVKNSSIRHLKRIFIGGGSVEALAIDPFYCALSKESLRSFESGTVPFQQILALEHGFNFVEHSLGGWINLSNHCQKLAENARTKMVSLKYDNGSNLIKLLGQDYCKLGPIISFLVLDRDGIPIGYSDVLRLASGENIHLRAGRFCNPGAAQEFLQLSSSQIKKNHRRGHICGDQNDQFDGAPTGALRISFSYSNTENDVIAWITFLRSCYLQAVPMPAFSATDPKDLRLADIFIYPIKSCGEYRVNKWQLSSAGLFLDRRFVIMDSHNRILTQKTNPLMKLIQIKAIDLFCRIMVVSALGMPDLVINFENEAEANGKLQICHRIDSYFTPQQHQAQDEWFSQFLGFPCRLITASNNIETPKGFMNKHHFLLISQSSVDVLKQEIHSEHVSSLSFRPNFVIEGTIPFIENEWIGKDITISGVQFSVKSLCERCQMICIDDEGKRKAQPLKALSKRRVGVYLFYCSDNWFLGFISNASST